MFGTKCHSLREFCQNRGIGFLCFDYRGHGSSSGNFIDFTLHDWIDDARNMLNHVILRANGGVASPCTQQQHQQQKLTNPLQQKVILVGSSMGAWIALHLAMECSESISAVIGVGSAIDFTYHTFHEKLTAEQRAAWTNEERDTCKNDVKNEAEEKDSIFYISSPYLDEPYPFSKALYESGNQYLMCHNKPGDNSSIRNGEIKLKCPVRFLHGMDDDVVHWSEAIHAVEILQSKFQCVDVKVKLLEGDHRLSRPEDISVLMDTLEEFL